ncbi:NYN domain-containing protein [Salininema proteolyticum]|uniref:NYN domain-containing protein n=1 Tax=Salininema proteolyticum TaxID=1607685 RepID=A0ABV8U1U8_9ACTN
MSEETTDPASPLFLPEPARRRIVDLAASTLPAMGPAEVPPPLRKFIKFNQPKRVKLGSTAIIRELEVNPEFREKAGGVVSGSGDELVRRFVDGDPPVLTEPALAAALSYLLQPDGWRDTAAAAVAALEAENRAKPEPPAPAPVPDGQVERLEKENTRLRDALADQRKAAADLHQQVRTLHQAVTDLTGETEKLRSDVAAEKGRMKQVGKERKAERRRHEAELASVRTELAELKQHEREDKRLGSTRMWLLLETLSGTAAGIRRELGLDPAETRPGDYVAAEKGAEPETIAARARGLDSHDPAHLDELLDLPQPHLIVDGYNVTLTAWKDSLTLEQQRERLVRGLGLLAGQKNAEITVVFDGSDPVFGAAPSARGVRVLFSAKGRIADDVVVDLARAEPEGRPVVVVSNDQEVQERSRREGARIIPSMTLVKRISRY